ncbi:MULTISPECIES: asparagine synthase (glutamine-hydrolyzing) [Methylosinus]|nr:MULTISPECIES: asparagine synthase (glutamine-hydrolyzing) [Methylosinus]MBU3889581.1 asparagine synthase (glutamine-hydrolyzing) [Methylosinus sp. KRF6]
MCGIAGIIRRGGHDREDMSRMLDLMGHRGPDGHDQWQEAILDGPRVTLGHRRLAIIDLSQAATQPMADVSGRYILTFNGEIYNYLELRAELVRSGARFRTDSDSEVILEAYKQSGNDCVSRFNGMFAFAIYDRLRKRLFCARDRYGEKPFLFCSKPSFFAFASEYKALLAQAEVSARYDEFRLIRAGYNPSTGLDADRQTTFDDIQQLRPGEALEIDCRDFTHRIWRYYEPRFDPSRWNGKEEDAFAEFRELLIDSVRLRLWSDVTVGSCLSGGLDSSAIVCIARRLLGDDAPYETFTGVFPGTYADEKRFADEVIAKTGVGNHVVEPTCERFIAELPRFVWLNELPVGTSSQFAQWCVFELAAQHGVTVLLDGQGSDELLGGYPSYYSLYVESLTEIGDHARLDDEIIRIDERYPSARDKPLRRLRDSLPFSWRHAFANRTGTGSSILYGLSPDVAAQSLKLSERERLAGFNPLSSALAEDSFGRFLTTLLRYGDRNSMAHSREVRLPFCDHRLADLALSLPPHLLMGEIQTKRLLRESMRGILPEPIRTRWAKRGFLPPQELWFKSARMRAIVRDTLSSSSFRESPYWTASWWNSLLDRIDRGDWALGWTAWQPFMIESWKRHFVAEATHRTAALEKVAS